MFFLLLHKMEHDSKLRSSRKKFPSSTDLHIAEHSVGTERIERMFFFRILLFDCNVLGMNMWWSEEWERFCVETGKHKSHECCSMLSSTIDREKARQGFSHFWNSYQNGNEAILVIEPISFYVKEIVHLLSFKIDAYCCYLCLWSLRCRRRF